MVGLVEKMKPAMPPTHELPGAISLPQAQGRGATAIAAQLRASILGGTYSVGDRLPPERDIARALGASRTTVRNALRLLEDDDLVTRKVGSGTYVTQQVQTEDDDIAETTSPLELVEVRTAIEPRMVRLAVLNGKPRDLDRLWDALTELERAGPDADRFSRCDQQLHLALAQATHNPLLVWLYRQVNRIRSHRHWVAVQFKVLTPERIAAYNAEHRSLVEAISIRDGERAVEIIQQHLQAARRDLLGVLPG
jgi:DNA-binding FadR family transcriptional regulator